MSVYIIHESFLEVNNHQLKTKPEERTNALRGNVITGCSVNGVTRVRSTYHAHKGEGGAMYSESLFLER